MDGMFLRQIVSQVGLEWQKQKKKTKKKQKKKYEETTRIQLTDTCSRSYSVFLFLSWQHWMASLPFQLSFTMTLSQAEAQIGKCYLPCGGLNNCFTY